MDKSNKCCDFYRLIPGQVVIFKSSNGFVMSVTCEGDGTITAKEIKPSFSIKKRKGQESVEKV